MAKAEFNNYIITSDNSGHDYLILAESEKRFDELVNQEYGWGHEDWQQFESCRIEGQRILIRLTESEHRKIINS